MGLREKYAEKIEEKGFRPLELNKGNVQAIFNRCLATKESTLVTTAMLFHTTLGHSREETICIKFDKERLSQNKKTIVYLYGQLSVVHREKYKCTLEDFSLLYSGSIWHSIKNSVLQLLHLGSNGVVGCVGPFKKVGNEEATVIASDIKPTLSPRDPNFPAWWEAHKAEWEQ